jgi:hypothetical protein
VNELTEEQRDTAGIELRLDNNKEEPTKAKDQICRSQPFATPSTPPFFIPSNESPTESHQYSSEPLKISKNVASASNASPSVIPNAGFCNVIAGTITYVVNNTTNDAVDDNMTKTKMCSVDISTTGKYNSGLTTDEVCEDLRDELGIQRNTEKTCPEGYHGTAELVLRKARKRKNYMD